ncbi:MAG: hypothetical protein DYG88_16120 [Chloroflexi bacterium CFX4]|nr:hypothetical protein [Chloroflexi bacterium CFX4]
MHSTARQRHPETETAAETGELSQPEQSPPAPRSVSQRAASAWRDIREASGTTATLIKAGVVLMLAWLLAGAVQQLAVIGIVIAALWLVFDVVRRNILRR